MAGQAGPFYWSYRSCVADTAARRSVPAAAVVAVARGEAGALRMRAAAGLAGGDFLAGDAG